MLDFLKRGSRPAPGEPSAPEPEPEEIAAEDHSVVVHFRAKSSAGVRMAGRPRPADALRPMVAELAASDVEVIEPRSIELGDAAPDIERPREALHWLEANSGRSSIARHALRVLETVGAIDLAVDTFACVLLHGELDTSGYPSANAIVGGIASHWDAATGDLICRAVVGWGGQGLRGDTDRTAQRILGLLHARIVARTGDLTGS